jgi:type IV pilus assembly protein PilQ
MTALILAIGLALQVSPATEKEETRVDFDVKNAEVTDILRLFAEIGNFNLVADPGVECQLTLRMKAVTWPQALAVVLKSCKLAQEKMGENLVRVAPLEELRRELEEKRKYEEEKALAGPLQTTYRRLAYARAKEIVPVLQKFLSPRGDVSFDERTNTLIITDVAR